MTHSTKNPMHRIISDVIAGSMIFQRASRLGVDVEQLLDSAAPDTTEIYTAITEFGLNPEGIASNTLASLDVFLRQPQIAQASVDRIATLLWDSLGDPDNNGSTPPDSYKEAAARVYTWIMSCFFTSALPSNKN